jgi:hypothetical protein
MQDNVQFIIILAVIVLGAILVARFWRTILKWLLLVAGLVLIIGIVGLWLKNGTAVPQVDIQLPEDAGGVVETIAGLLDLAGAILPKSEPTCPTPTYVAPAGPSFGEILLSVLLVLALGGAGYFWIRWRIAGRRGGVLPRPRHRRRRPDYDQQPVIYIVPEYEDDEDDADGYVDDADGYVDEGVDLGFLGGLDPGTWGF